MVLNSTILLVDDHAVVREGVRRLLAELPATDLLEAETGESALEIVAKERPGTILLDLNLSGLGGLELLRRLRDLDKDVRVIVFTMHAEPAFAARAMQLGAQGYVSKGAGAQELLSAVKCVQGGGQYVEQGIAKLLASRDDGGPSLTRREVDVLRLLGEGKSITAIADSLGIAYKTVANSCTRLKDKLGLQTTAELVRYAMKSAN